MYSPDTEPEKSASYEWQKADQAKRRKMLANIGETSWRNLSWKNFTELDISIIRDLNYAATLNATHKKAVQEQVSA